MSEKPSRPIALRVEEISKSDASKLFEAAAKHTRTDGRRVMVVPEHMEYRPIASPAARHVAEKIRNAIRAGVTVDVFGKKRLTGVVLDLELAEEFVGEVETDEE